MKKLVLGAVTLAALGFTVPALAADLPVKAPVYAKAPAMVPMFNWERCYVGGQIGYGWGQSTVGAQSPQATSGVIGGAQAGCNWQPNKSFIIGFEADIWWSDMKARRSIQDPDVLIAVVFADLAYRNRWDADLTLRLGMPMDRALFYVKGGGAVGDFAYSWNGAVPWSGSATKWGWLIGAGVEYAFSNNWSAKIEYNYIDFGSGTVNTNLGSITTRETKNVVKLGVNYLFGGPVVAKY